MRVRRALGSGPEGRDLSTGLAETSRAMTHEDRKELLALLRTLREQCAIAGDWAWFAVYDARIRALTERSATWLDDQTDPQ